MEAQIQHIIYFNKPIDHVFDYLTTLSHWAKWHPATICVSGQTEQPAQKGDKVSETVKTAGIKGNVSWIVTACQRPRFWAMEIMSLSMPFFKKVKITISYALTPKNGGTELTRCFSYRLPSMFLRFINTVYFRHHLESESDRALNRLKELIEE
ncbi:SRPBCC family protein [candidate division CSSED10-310 bacterium]|uniref:SRPBCC family protein n=1 Tax=candidate division CSSED10-310 bacterium TaxID=2855610 RepID=A0ABV6Z3E5_UNCC1